MASDGEQGVEVANPLLHVAQKAGSIQKLFTYLPPPLQLEGLDILQGLVNSVMKKMTQGRISAVRFVPVRADSSSDETPEQPPEQPPEDTTSDIQPKIEIKEEPSDEAWNQTGSAPVDSQTEGSEDFEKALNNLENGVLADSPLMTSTPKSKSKAKAKAKAKKAETTTRKKPAGKRKLIDSQSTTPNKLAKENSEKSDEKNAPDSGSPKNSEEDQELDTDVDILDDSGIGDSTLDVSANQNNQTLPEGDAVSTDTDGSYLEDFDSKDSGSSSDVNEVKVNQKSNSKNVITWSRFPPKKRKKRDQSSLPYHCTQCSFATGRKYSLDTHMSLHTGESKHKCEECGKVFTAASSLKRHLMLHEGVKPFHCPVCQKKFVDLAGLKTHSAVHTGERMFKCDQCPKAYTNHANLARHKRVHTGEMPYVCKYENCDAKFRDLSSLKLHILKHTGEKPYSCPICEKKFKTSSDFRRHERTHTQERNYKCTQCGKKFIQGYHLKQHLKIHADLWLFGCELCGKRFRTKASLQHHEKGHAGIKDYTCDLCKSSFTTKRYLNDHYIAAHTKARPYKCDVCGKGFNHISNMKRHKRMHSDVCKYKCKYCNRSFKYINSLQYHEGIHTGAKKMCEKCGYTCRSAFGMKAHVCEETMLDRKKRNQRAQEDEDEEEEDEEFDFSEAESTAKEEETSSDSVEIVDIKEEPKNEEEGATRTPRAAARKSGLVHTPRKSKQRAIKMIENIAEEMNIKEPRVSKQISGTSMDDPEIQNHKKAEKRKTSPRTKITPVVPVNPPAVQTLGVVIKQELVEIHDTNSEPDVESEAVGGSADKASGRLSQESHENGGHQTPAKPAAKPKPKGGKAAPAKNKKENKSKLPKINGSAEVAVENHSADQIQSKKQSNQDTNKSESQNASGQEVTSSDTSNQPSFSDVSVMQEAYGACTLTSTEEEASKGLQPPEHVSSFEDLERCMPIITQVYSVSGSSV